MRFEEIKGLTTDEIVEKLRDERAMYTKLKFNHAVTPLENPNKLKASKRLIARYLTELNTRKKAQ